MKAILINPNEGPKVVNYNGYDELAALVGGGMIEGLSIGRRDAHAFGNDEAKIINHQLEDGTWVEGMPENVLATKLIYGNKEDARIAGAEQIAEFESMGFAIIDATGNDPREPFIAGPIVICGVDPDTGESLDVPEALVWQLCP